MIHNRKRSLNEASSHPPFGALAGAFVRILLVGLLTVGVTASSLAQARPNIQWMRGAIAGNVSQIALSPDGTSLAMCGSDGTTKIRRLSDGMLLETLSEATVTGRPPIVTSVAFTSDGKKLLTGNNNSIVHLWNLADGAVVSTLTTLSPVNVIAIAPDQSRFAVGETGNNIEAFRLADFSVAGTFGGHTAGVSSLAFSPDSQKLASGSADGTIRIWDVPTASTLKTLADGNTVTGVAFTSDGTTLCSGDSRGILNIWNPSTGGAALRTITGPSGGGQTVPIAISPDNTQVSAGFYYDTKVYTWRISDAKLLASADTTLSIISLAYSKDGSQIYTANFGNYVSIWSGLNLASLGNMPAPYTTAITNVATNPTGTMVATTCGTGTVNIWDPSGAPITAITPMAGTSPATQLFAIAFSSDGANIAISGYVRNSATYYLWIYRISDGMQMRQVAATVNSLAYTPDGTTLAAAVGNNISLYRLLDMSLVHTLTSHPRTVYGIAISPDGSTLASASGDGTVKTWSLSSFSLLTTLSKHAGSVNAVSFSPDSSEVIDVSSDGTSILWHLTDSTILQTFTDPEGINTAAISRDGKQVATGGVDRRLRLWNTVTGALLYDYTQETGAGTYSSSLDGVTSVAYSADGKFLFYGRDDATLAVAVNPLFVPLITGLTLSPSTTVGGTVVTGTVTLNSTTLSGGAVVSLSSSDTTIATVPATVTVSQGLATANFNINTSGVTAQSFSNIKASLNGSSASARLTVTTPTVLSLLLSPTSVRGGQNSTGTVTLTGPAPAGGSLTVTLSSNNINAIAPANVTVAAGATSATFTIPTNVVGTQNTALITATLGTSATANLTINPPVVTALSTAPANLKGGQPSVGTVTISDPAPTGGIVVNISGNNDAAAKSDVTSVTVAKGATTATFNITTHPVSDITQVTFTASFNGSSQTTVLTVTPPTVSTVTLNPTSVKGGSTSTGTVTISDPAPTAGVVITLSSANTDASVPVAATVPANVTVLAGSTSATFTVNTIPVSTDKSVDVTATINKVDTKGTLTVLAPLVATLAVNPLAVPAFQTATVTVTLDGPAPTGGIVVTLFSSDTSVATLPATVTVAAGATVGTATVSTFAVSVDTRILLAATLGTSNASVHLIVQPSQAPTTFYWRNDLSGNNVFWQLNGTTITNSGSMLTVSDLSWKMVAAVDLFHKGNTDVIWQNSVTGDIVYWDVKNGVVVSSGYIQTVTDHNWKIVGSADLFHKGNTDIIWQNTSNGDIIYWEMNGATYVGGDYLKTVSDLNWKIFAVADLFHQGNYDLIWQNTSTGDVVYWDMSGAAIASSGYIKTLADKNWKLVGSGDLFHQSHTDLIWQNGFTGDIVYWDLTGSALTGSGYIYTVPNLQWKIRAIR